ncbi:hypothetical protein CPT_Privateer_142 [Proteus phage Privateer]|uniref:Uncharacterized protein n=1 Tax=Proteus phage Privateer TaxID=2712958 RepID=A0A6G8R409_9CAUD|nr:hypothetical protein HWD17_gp114 [Proteus phage Privateer]QIN94932.1 hypothetical protein CPT_Privateer_142 [Proteus phage Privateer]
MTIKTYRRLRSKACQIGSSVSGESVPSRKRGKKPKSV